MNKVYIETSIVSYASAWPSRDIGTAALQQQARDWWQMERPTFDLVTSQLTLDEASAGDANAAADRLKLLDGLPLVDINPDTELTPIRKLWRHDCWPLTQCRKKQPQMHCMLPLLPLVM